ncbi:uncharacterized protein LOC123720756 isoform X1 [Pieris brassicae]|uniref:uncharacterized protein LOC123720756 isoform X1 n=1 Tax=Pieris brassicae TaxID=7116 RepID=UPI001E65E48E|nr:uncharacterized protein LOC123720756 isoform X1 [Pieris brassicae]
MMLKMFLLLSVLIGLSSAQILQDGKCDTNIALEDNFNLEAFTGKWHNIEGTPGPLQSGDCSTLEITSRGTITTETSTLDVKLRSVNENFLRESSGVITARNGTAKLTINLESIAEPIIFQIMVTNYENYALAFSCENVGTTQRNVHIWQLGRDTSFPTEMIINLMNNTMYRNFELTRADLSVVDNSGAACHVLPVIPPGQAIILPGQCDPNLRVEQEFNPEQFKGVWHQIASYYTPNTQGQCNRAEYTLRGDVIDVVNSEVNNGTLRTITGSATISSSDGSAKLNVTLEVIPDYFVSQPLWILATNYNTYAVSYTCVDLPEDRKQVTSWILSRSRNLTDEARTEVNRVIDSYYDLNRQYFVDADQSDDACFYLPPPTGKPVVFRGQCDESIKVMLNFTAELYGGLWYNIESYPSPNQQGSCRNARYSLADDGTVDVFNTQVIGEELLTINGVATVSNDGSARLRVSFPIPGTNRTTLTDYWVLSTDYKSYAIVYSCTNLNEDERSVYVWKLSRTKELPAEADTEFDVVSKDIPVINQMYLEKDNQNKTACFYYPKERPGVPVVFPGRCSDDDIPVINNFNASAFTGVWFEIQAYPKEFQPGQCIRHDYSQSGNNLTLTTSSVDNQFLTISTSDLVTSGSSGKLSINTVGPNGTTITIPFWILSVDYNDYAFAYSCMDLEEDHRAIYSWKLSRNQNGLSTEAHGNIDNVMSNVVVLERRYYENVDQTDNACFYLPDLAPGEPVILEGQCDLDIPVVENFNATEYLGRWRLIESYPAEQQTGTCNEAYYSAGSGNTIEVVNSQVVGDELNSVTGTAEVESNGKLKVTFPNSPDPAYITIINTDYKSYSLVYSCTNLPDNKQRIFSWKLSRTKSLTEDATESINTIMNNIRVLNNKYFQKVDQSDIACFYLPPPGPYPVIFRGQCDPNITTVPKFEASRYLNLWHNIESYPSTFQTGTCNNAFYSAGTTSDVDVYNTQVIDRQLDTIRGTANLAGDPDVGKLIVSFPIAGTNQTTSTDYLILATDYISYALVYTCYKVDEEHRAVLSWKLSRSKSLTTDAQTAINAVISTIPVLNQKYYERNNQSAEGCFYFPDPEPGKVVEFPGKCDQTIPAVPNFNFTAFRGTWYEIQAYPKEQQTGQCVSHTYSEAGSNTLQLISNQVLNQGLIQTNSDVRLTSSQDPSGKLTITIRTNGSDEEIPFWVLSTDYEDYALAYSCVDIPNHDRRKVFSWKLSRSKTLSTAGDLAITNAMSDIDVLDRQYYQNINQSYSACFYLPDIPHGEPVIFPGKCDLDIPVVRDFNVTRYLGRWRMLETYHSEFQRGTCNDATYTLLNDGTVSALNSQVINEELDTITGIASASSDGSAKLSVKFPTTTEAADYWVLNTDYDSYALVYSCKNLENNQKRVWSWKLSRNRELSTTAIDNINSVIRDIDVLNSRYYKTVGHTDKDCFYYPVPDGRPVKFRGQCDESISGVNLFRAGDYLNLWHNIESYPSNFQTGTCNNAFYSAGTTSDVDVYNTQVIDRQLDTIRGTANLAGDPNVGELIVSFPIAGTNQTTSTDYLILATDYISYALVYTCYKVDEEHRAVLSWKLSRSKSLTTEAHTAINAVINTIPVLNQKYYERNNQSAEGCFYFPDPEPGKVVEFPGKCDQNIPAIPNFNFTAFRGTWYEIQAYPKEQQTGQCVSHTYSEAGSNTLQLISNQVLNQGLIQTNSDVRLTSSQDPSGKLTITIRTNGSDEEIPFWVLSTDYEDYALAYSCVDIPNHDRRKVFSWKLSRSKTLSTAGDLAITNAMSDIDVLDRQYYQNINQSYSACFYLPDIPHGEPVIFPGKCDLDIPVVRDFNVTRYLGRWRMLETYHSEFQRGTCNDATYTLLNDGTVSALNSQVINEELDTITGIASASSDGSAKLSVKFPTTTEAADYWVLNTDYDSYALVYSCKNLENNQKRVWSWKLSRNRELSTTAIDNINSVIRDIDVLNSRYYKTVGHTDKDCFYYPVPDGRPVKFRGQCDESISGVNLFRAGDYLNLWHNIESYPSNFQTGTCNNAFYSAGTTSDVDVYNTQVIDRQLDTIRGTANLAGDPNVGELIVSFPIAGTNQTTSTDYLILATDYISYALVYTCYKVDEEHRAVLSWKLSRSKSLTTEAHTAINAVINTIPVLNQKYYERNNQSAEGCFYFPDPEPGKVVEFPGKCDQNIPAIPNFNFTAFRGTWYEIQAYPKEQQTGQCVSHTYSEAGSNTLQLISNQVLNQGLIQTNSDVRLTSSQDPSGKLTITIRTNGSDEEIPFWVLSTDYEDYALAYSCVDIPNHDRRKVFSWKLSRSKTLSTAGDLAITNAMSDIDVLDRQYYQNINQSYSACFYLPDIPHGEPVIFPGKCDLDIPVVRDFNVTRYLGRWRMLETYHSEFQRGTCNDATYTLLNDGTVSALNSQVINEELDTITGIASASSDGSAKLSVKFPTTTEAADYWVLNTDYDSYALVYSCKNLENNQKRVWSWKLSRNRELSTTAIDNINSVIRDIDVLNSRYYKTVGHTDKDCFYYPVPDGRPVKFRGQCDESISGVNLFRAGDYLNLWHNIESYPSNFQTGTCNNAFYSAGTTSDVDVYNTQVIDRQLDTIRGTANLAGDPNVGELIVSFPIAGTNQTTSTDYLILATDYISYALVYTCYKVDEEHRAVLSWKLSRSKSLTTEAHTAINAVINTIPVLNQKYYERNNQSAEGCFYFPDPEPGKVVEFPGKCDQNIPAIPNFNFTAFRGTWYEIQAYPKEQQTGQCVSHTYSEAGSNTLQLISNQVLNQGLIQTNSDVRLTSSQDPSGKLTITIRTNGSDEEIPFWVLSTDYEDYALAYSCVDIPNHDRRKVFSWKLSRSKTLSTAGDLAITNAMSDIDVLDRQYYQNINQSYSACFYLPDIPHGEPVIFPGKCDLDIPVVRDFNVTRYLGRWRMLETYHSEFQRGTCNDATYTLLNDGTVSALNSQVINEELDTITGIASASSDGSAKLSVKFPTTTEAADYWVLNTDYDSYALVYSCKNLENNQKRVWSWKLSRNRELSTTAIDNINSVIRDIDVLNSRYYKTVGHTDKDCFYYPVPDGRPVKFRGQCDESISGVNLFRAGDYLNLWHNIESYPSNFQTGTCNNAFYSAGTTSDVDVYNTQVIDRQLDTIRGTANLAGDPNVGELIVSFPIAGTNQTTSTDYLILATDYISYALVYTCYKVDEEHRAVLSWKLSRSKSLTTEAHTAINAVINTIPVLNQKYYERNNQSAEGCFYFPDPEPGKVVEFPGKCDQNIPAIPNFNFTAFRGTWYEIQAYPKEQQTGQCVSHTYSEAGSNTLQLISNQVLNQGLIQTNSDVRLTSSQDPSGKLTITIRTNGSDEEIPFWVLSTDYEDYALAYSCVDIPNHDRRKVFSWKLSRSKTLSTAGDLAITNAMSDIDVLDRQYYQNINQSYSACFYLPDIPHGEPVIFPGKCDLDIPVVRDFNVTRYLGRWRMLETYHSEFQRGTCNDATYTLLNDGTVSALNSQVINEELDTITGIASASSDGSAKLSVKFPTTTEAADYWVLNTDYDSYALVYSCKNLENNQKRVWSWKLSRTTELSPSANDNINAIIERTNVLNSRYYSKIQHSVDACFYYPEDNGQPLVFRGPCEENVPLVNNFNASNYLGSWYDIESYPTAYQFGSCPSATYTLNNPVVDVYNTEVINKRLSSVNGVAVPYSDGSSRLTVSFPIPGTALTTNTPYWILATDYLNYALVYSCVNDENKENRRVSSWKLSRTKYLSEESNTHINNVMNSVKVLRSKYYKERGHLDSNCFYFPENNGGPVKMPGECAASTIAIDNFDKEAFTGPWYEVSRFPSELKSGECVSNEFVSSNNGFTMKKTYVSDEELIEAKGSATLSNDTRGILTVNLTDGSGAIYETTMYVIDVNYTDYALLYGCRDIGEGRKQVYSWKLSRRQAGLSPEAVDSINKVVSDSLELWEGYYEDTDQTDKGCFHYPEYDTLPEEIVLIGRCDDSIKGVANFNASAYLGNWIEVASYPQRFQNGDCARAYYTSTDGVVVNVMNTQVINRSLDVAYATARVASNDSTGVLDVTFTMPVSITSNYYILATDYESYALVYSCRNLENGKRQVGSWKLRRGKMLSQEAEAIMDDVISNTEGLIQRNYKSTSQTEDACFYIPEADRNTPPVFRGQCQDVKGVEGFDIEKYVGWWHEIENYPSSQSGSCISSELVATENSYQMIDTSVRNNSATVITSTVTASSDGRLIKTFSDGSSVELLVIVTDYETFSLLYSCENINDDYKRVWSAKLSKTRELSENAQNVISQYMESNRVLEEKFYFSVNQSDSVCFHYPEITGDQVIIPGQCDDSIPVETSFDTAQYTGTWYQIERYPQRFESGNCTGARYSYNTVSSVITVQNWQVIDGTLDTVEGNATVTSVDGSAKLVVNLPVRGTDDPNPPMVSMDLYILKTDYISYSLAYSCVNRGPYKRAIGAWKLSRTRTMTEAGNTAITEYAVNRQEFNEDYFLKVGQSETCSQPSSGVIARSGIIVLIISIAILNFL